MKEKTIDNNIAVSIFYYIDFDARVYRTRGGRMCVNANRRKNDASARVTGVSVVLNGLCARACAVYSTHDRGGGEPVSPGGGVLRNPSGNRRAPSVAGGVDTDRSATTAALARLAAALDGPTFLSGRCHRDNDHGVK